MRPAFPPAGDRKIVPQVKATLFVRVELVDVAVFENAFGKRQLRCFVVDKQRAFDEFAMIKPLENYFAAKIEILSLKRFIPNDALFDWSIGTHFSFAIFLNS
jgi:hypothetical protein